MSLLGKTYGYGSQTKKDNTQKSGYSYNDYLDIKYKHFKQVLTS